VIAGAAGAALGQAPPAGDPTATPGQPAATPAPPTSDAAAKRERLLRAARLPKEADECRRKGVPDADMKETLRAAKRKGLKSEEMADVTSEQRKAIDEHGPVDNFGAFVQSKLDEGLRGRELAAAIHAEHAKRGKGKGYRPPGKGKDGRGRADDETNRDEPDRGKPKDRPGSEKGKGKGGG
jgi:hypothetical protein